MADYDDDETGRSLTSLARRPTGEGDATDALLLAGSRLAAQFPSWRVPERLRQKLLARCEDIIDDLDAPPKDVTAAGRVVIAADRINVSRERLALDARLGAARLQQDGVVSLLSTPEGQAALRAVRDASLIAPPADPSDESLAPPTPHVPPAQDSP